MTAAQHHWRSVAAYIILAAAVVGAVLGYQEHTNQRLDHADRLSCQNRLILTANQRVVLAILDRNITELVKTPGPAQKHFLASLKQVHQAQVKLAATPSC